MLGIAYFLLGKLGFHALGPVVVGISCDHALGPVVVGISCTGTSSNWDFMHWDQLSWEEQVDNISKKVSQGIAVLRRAKLFVKYDTLQILYNSLVQPYFEYCSLVWGNCCDSLKEKLQKL